MKMILELQQVTKMYKNGSQMTNAISDITYSLPEGGDLAIVGPSGSGKTTLLNMIGGLDNPTRGTVLIDGQNVSKMKDKELSAFRNKTIGFIFQFFNLQDYLKAYENVMIPMVFSGIKWSDAQKRAHELLEKVGLGNRADYYPKQLSGGEMQRVAIARSLANNPKMLLADEPTANLDKESAKTVINLFKEINKQGVSLIVITHDPSVSEQFTRRLVMSNGEMVKDKETTKSHKTEKHD